MILRHVRVHGGTWRIRAANAELAAALPTIAQAACAGPVRGPLAWNGIDAFHKGDALRGRASWRWALRRAPRERELFNFAWLGERLFRVPRPLGSAVLRRAGLPRYQLLVSEHLAHVVPLADWLAADRPRGDVLAALAREVARMHALGFVHRDLYLRNLLVPGDRDRDPRPFFVDAWRGGAHCSWRGPAWDLGCFFLHAPTFLAAGEQAEFLATYFEERAAQGRPLARDSFLAAVTRARDVQVARLRSRPRRVGTIAAPAEWRPPH